MKGYNDWKNAHFEEMDLSTLNKVWNATSSYKSGYTPNVEKGHARFMADLDGKGNNNAKIFGLKSSRTLMRIAAAVVLLVVAGVLFNSYFGNDGMNRVATNTQEKKELALQDGSEITLNGSSNLQYPTSFAGEERKVILNGEGFFNISEDASKPFIVETEVANIRVLGTSFNVRSYEDGTFEVFVASGNVAVDLTGIDKTFELAPGDLLTYDKSSGSYSFESDEEQNTLAWKSGSLKFSKKPMSDIFTSLERLFNVEIEAEKADLLNCVYTFHPKKVAWQSIVDDLEAVCEIKFNKVNNNKFLVTGSCCE